MNINIKSSAKPIAKKLGSMAEIDIDTGEVVNERKNAFTLMPCKPNVCQVCAVDHPHDTPHSVESLYYQYRFHSEHGRWPNWADAMAHCPDDTKELWREKAIEIYQENGLEVPAELLAPKPAGR